MDAPKYVQHRGCKLAYRVGGHGPNVLMIQGAGMPGEGWRPQIDDLTNDYRCLWFDNRGIGQSQPIAPPITIEQMAEDARVLMDAEGWESAHVVGHSMGGLIAVHLALSEPRRVRSLALLCTFARGRDAARMSPDMFWLGLRTYVGTQRMRRQAFLEMVMPPEYLRNVDRDALAERLAPIFGHDLAHQPPVVMHQLRALHNYDAVPNLPKLSGLPTLIVSARHDRIVKPGAGKTLASGIGGARYIEFSDAGHGATIQCTDEINRLLHEHFSAVP